MGHSRGARGRGVAKWPDQIYDISHAGPISVCSEGRVTFLHTNSLSAPTPAVFLLFFFLFVFTQASVIRVTPQARRRSGGSTTRRGLSWGANPAGSTVPMME